MKIPTYYPAALVFTSLAAAHCAHALTPPNEAAPPEESTAGWSLIAGARFSEMNIDFSSLETYDIGLEDSDEGIGFGIEFGAEILHQERCHAKVFASYGFASGSFATGEQTIGERYIPGDELYTLTIADVDVDVHQIQVGLDVSVDLGGGFELGLAAGPTLNIVRAEWSGRTETFRESDLGFAGGHSADGSESETVFGASAELRLRYNFPGRNVFIQLAAGYNWMDDADVSHAGVNAKLDASSFAVSAGIGIRF